MLNRGVTVEEYNAFVQRADVMFEMNVLREEYARYEETFSKVRFASWQRLAELADNAIDVVESAIKGPEYGFEKKTVTKNGKKKTVKKRVVVTPEPTNRMVKASLAVLETLGLGPDEAKMTPKLNDPAKKFVNSQDAQSAVARIAADSEGKTDAIKSYSREKVRNVVDDLLRRLQDEGKTGGEKADETAAT